MQRSMRSLKRLLKPLALCTLVLPLGACSLPEALAALFHQNETHMALGVCPALPAPPQSVVDALDQAAAADPAAADYEVALAKHYDKLDACAAVHP